MEAVEFGTFANNGIIEIPAEYRKDFSTNIRVILMKHNDAAAVRAGIREKIAAAERLAGMAAKTPMTIEEIRNERLARQSAPAIYWQNTRI